MDGEIDTDNYIKLTFFCELSSFINKITFLLRSLSLPLQDI